MNFILIVYFREVQPAPGLIIGINNLVGWHKMSLDRSLVGFCFRMSDVNALGHFRLKNKEQWSAVAVGFFCPMGQQPNEEK